MSLQNLINQENDENYISLFNAINLLAKNSNIYDVAIYLLNKNIHIDLDSYKENYDCKIIQSSFTDIPNKTWSGDNFAYSLLNEIVDIEKRFPLTTLSEFDRYSELSQSTYWDKKQFFSNSFIMRALDHNTNKNCCSTELQPESQLMQTKEVPLFYLNDTFSLTEASCLISGDDPIQMNRCLNDTYFDQNYPSFNEAYNFLNSAIYAGKLSEPISSTQLKEYLSSKCRIIDGFNDQLKNEVTDHPPTIDQLKKENEELKQLLKKSEAKIAELAIAVKATENTLDKVKITNEKLKTELLEKNEEINKLQQDQKSSSKLENHIEEQEILTPHQEIPNSKTRNKVSILIAVLCELNKLDITRHQGEPNTLILDQASKLKASLGKDFVGNWLKLARENIE